MIGQDQPAFFRSGEFAEMSGVTIRTLRFYDRIGLLSPSRRTETGHRLYGVKDLSRLEQIQALKFIGLPLESIRRWLTEAAPDMVQSLQSQRQALVQKVAHLQLVVKAIDEAEKAAQTGTLSWPELARIIKVIQMEKNMEWFKGYYTQDQLDQLARREWTPQDQAGIEREWDELYRAVRNRLTLDPSNPEVQALAERWLELVGRFTQGDPGLEKSLKNAYSNMDQAPPEVRNEHRKNQDIFVFMNKAIAIYKANHPES